MLAFFRICRYNLYCALRRRIEVVITGLTRNQVASRGLEGSNPSVSASATGNAFKRCLFSFRCAGGDGEPEPLRGLELHAIGQPRCYILIRFACQQSLKGESLRPYSYSRKCFQALPFFIWLRRRRRRARAPARARAARDWAILLLHPYTLCVPTIAERRIPPSIQPQQAMLLIVVFFHLVAPAETESPSLCEGSSCTRLGGRANIFLHTFVAANR